MRHPENIRGIAAVLAWLLAEISKCLGQKICSTVLYGSATLGDFCPRWSDVDVCVVLETPITPEEGQSIGNVHDRLRERFISEGCESWESGQAVEGSYVPVELVTDEKLEMPCYTAGGSTRKWAVCHPISPFDRYMLAHFGHLLSGVAAPFTPPCRQSLVSQAETDLSVLRTWNHSEQSAIWLAGMLHWAARSLVFWRDGKMLSKSAALEHEIAHGSPFSTAFQLALAIRREGSRTAADHHAELKRHFSPVAVDLAQEIDTNMKAERGAQPGDTDNASRRT